MVETETGIGRNVNLAVNIETVVKHFRASADFENC